MEQILEEEVEEITYDEILLSRLNKYKKGICYWPNVTININDVKIAIENNVKEVNERYDSYDSLNVNLKTKEWHLGRIVYFINNPDKIDPIQIDNKCYGSCISGTPIIEDGNHRFMALLYLKVKKIKINYCGRCDVLEYLKGTTNEIPE